MAPTQTVATGRNTRPFATSPRTLLRLARISTYTRSTAVVHRLESWRCLVHTSGCRIIEHLVAETVICAMAAALGSAPTRGIPDASCDVRFVGCRQGGRTSPSARGAPCARTTAPTATPGTTSRTTTPGRGPTAGTRTAWPGSATTSGCASALALWNGRDPILKERMFGLTGPEGNHGEDVKEYWWYLDSTPTHSWMRWRYHYPQAAFPYDDLVAENAPARQAEPEYELLDTGVFDDDRYWVVDGRLRQGRPRRPAACGSRVNERARRRRCTCCRRCGSATPGRGGATADQPSRCAGGATAPPIVAEHPILGALEYGRPATATTRAAVLRQRDQRRSACSARRRSRRTRRTASTTTSCTARPRSTRTATGTKAAAWYQLTVGRRGDGEMRLRLRVPTPDAAGDPPPDLGAGLRRGGGRPPGRGRRVLRRADAGDRDADEALVMRQAFAGLLWGKQFYHYDVARWLDGDPGQPPPPAGRGHGRNGDWRHLNNADVISMPDTWEYPWFAAWDLAFHCVALAHVDPEFAKASCCCCCREWYMHPNGQLPAYEWAFGDVNPPVHAWAALRVFEIDGSKDHAFLERVFHKLLLNFTWWVNRKDTDGNNVFEGGFLGLDNIGPFDRSAPARWRPARAVRRHRLDGDVRAVDARDGARPGRARPHVRGPGDEVLRALRLHRGRPERRGPVGRGGRLLLRPSSRPDGAAVPLRVRSMVGLIRAGARRRRRGVDAAAGWTSRLAGLLARDLGGMERLVDDEARTGGRQPPALLAWSAPDRLVRILARLFDEDEFLSPYGLRSLSRYHLEHPFTIEVDGAARDRLRAGRVDHGDVRRQLELARPGLVPGQLPRRRGARALPPVLRRRPDRRVPDRLGPAAHPRPGRRRPRGGSSRCSSMDEHGRRPVFGDTERFQTDPAWHDNLLVPRVLPRRQRRRARRLAPDRLDRPRRRPHPPCSGIYAVADLPRPPPERPSS